MFKPTEDQLNGAFDAGLSADTTMLACLAVEGFRIGLEAAGCNLEPYADDLDENELDRIGLIYSRTRLQNIGFRAIVFHPEITDHPSDNEVTETSKVEFAAALLQRFVSGVIDEGAARRLENSYIDRLITRSHFRAFARDLQNKTDQSYDVPSTESGSRYVDDVIRKARLSSPIYKLQSLIRRARSNQPVKV